MLQLLRDKTTGWLAVVIVAFLSIPFAFWGVENYFFGQNVATYVAKVNKVEIGQDQFRERFEDYRSRMRQVLADQYDAQEFDTPIVRRQVLDALIDEEVLRQASIQHGLTVPPAALQREIGDIDAFRVNGQFDAEQYRLVLANAGMTPRIFESRVANDLLTRLLPGSVTDSGLVTSAYIDHYMALRDQTRTFSYVLLPAADDEAIGVIEESDITAYYDAHPAQFESPETVTVDYLELDASGIELTETVDESTLRQRYEENLVRYVEPERRLTSHILIQTPRNADAQTEQGALDEATELVRSLRDGGADFSELAREHSQDAGSSSQGGDLGWIERGFTEPAFEDALFAMAGPGVSDPVKGSEGWHVIWLREVEPEHGKAFEEVRDELESEYLETERERAYSDLSGRLIDAVYRDPTTLENAANELGLEIKRAGPFTRDGGAGIFSEANVLRAIFADSVLIEGLASDFIETGVEHGVVVHVHEHVPVSVRPLDEVRDEVIAAVREQRRIELGRAALDAAAASIDSLETLQAWAQEQGLEVQVAEKVGRAGAIVDPDIARVAFALAHPGADVTQPIGSVALAEGAGAVIALTEVQESEADADNTAQRDMLRAQFARALGAFEARELVKALRKEATIDVVESRL